MRNQLLTRVGVGVVLMGGLVWGQTTGPTTRADSTASTRVGATTQALLTDLASDDWRVRQGAINELVKRGVGARGEIERVLAEATDPSAQADLRAALRQIEENARFGPTLITMHLGDGAKAKDAFDELSRQSGVRLVGAPPNIWDMPRAGREVTGDWQGAPFWKVLADLSERTGMVPGPGGMGNGSNDPSEMMLMMGNNNMFCGPICVSGPCAVIASSIQRGQSVTYARPGMPGGNRTADLRMQLFLWVEPKVRVIRMNSVSVTEATDELGNSLVKAGEMAGGWPNGRGLFNVSLGLRDVDGIGKSLAVLKGTARLGAVGSAETLEASTSGTGVGGPGKIVNGMRVRVTDLKAEGTMFTVKISCATDDRRQQFEPLWETAQTGAIRMIDADGRSLTFMGANPLRTATSMDITARYQLNIAGPNGQAKATEPIRMVWEVPVSVHEMGVAFEFRDLPLP